MQLKLFSSATTIAIYAGLSGKYSSFPSNMHSLFTLAMLSHLPLSMAATVKMPNTDMAVLGNIYLPVSDYSNSIFDNARQTLTNLIEDAIATGKSKYGPMFNNTAFSASVFSLKTGEPIFEYNFEAPELPKSSYTKGRLSENTIYRTGSLGKLLTIYTWLANLGDSMYMDPITKYIVRRLAFDC
jgi:hypothetical protein